MASFHDSHSRWNASALVIDPDRLADSGYVGWRTVAYAAWLDGTERGRPPGLVRLVGQLTQRDDRLDLLVLHDRVDPPVAIAR